MIFADTSFLLAGIDRRDTNYEAALSVARRTHGVQVVTTNHVRGEAWTLIRRKLWHGKAVEFLNGLDEPRSSIAVEWVDEQLEGEALAWLRRHDEREYSFVDAASFVFMRRHGITEALAFDGDFAAAGFVELRP